MINYLTNINVQGTVTISDLLSANGGINLTENLLNFGTLNNDMSLSHDGSNGYLDVDTGDFYIRNSSNQNSLTLSQSSNLSVLGNIAGVNLTGSGTLDVTGQTTLRSLLNIVGAGVSLDDNQFITWDTGTRLTGNGSTLVFQTDSLDRYIIDASGDHNFQAGNITTTGTITGNRLYSNNQATANNELVRLDQLNSIIGGLDWQESVLDQLNLVTSEPASPTIGDRYISLATGTSSATSQVVTIHYIYEWNGTDWTEFIPNEGWTCWVEDVDTNFTYNGSTWVEFGSTVSHNNTTGLQGGQASQYYHLNLSDYTNLTADSANLAYTNVDNNFSIGQTIAGALSFDYGGGSVRPKLYRIASTGGLAIDTDGTVSSSPLVSFRNNGNDVASVSVNGTFNTDGAVVAQNHLHTQDYLRVVNTYLSEYDSTNTDITSLVSGSTFGAILEGPSAGHLVIGIKGNDSGDGFSIIGRSDYNVTPSYDELLFEVNLGGAILNKNLTMNGDIKMGDSDIAYFGTGNDLRVYHNGSNSYIQDSGTGELRVLASTFSLRNSGDTELMLTATQDGAVNLYNNNNLRLSTTSSGVDISGTLDVSGTTNFSGNVYIDQGSSLRFYNTAQTSWANFEFNEGTNLVDISRGLNITGSLGITGGNAQIDLYDRTSNGDNVRYEFSGGEYRFRMLDDSASTNVIVSKVDLSNYLTTFNYNVTVNGSISATDGTDTAKLLHYGLVLNRASNYITPATNAGGELFIGGASKGSTDWTGVKVYTDGTNDFQWNDEIVATQDWVTTQIQTVDTLQEVTDNGNTTTNEIITSSSANATPTAETAVFSKFGLLANRGSMYFTNAGGDIRFGVGATHSASNTLTINGSGLNVTGTITNSGAISSSGNLFFANTANRIYTNNDLLLIDADANANGTSSEIRLSGSGTVLANFVSTGIGLNVDTSITGTLDVTSYGAFNNYISNSANVFNPLRLTRTGTTENINIQFTHNGGTRYLGMGSDETLRWGSNSDSALNDVLATQNWVTSQIQTVDTLQEVTDNGASTTNGIVIIRDSGSTGLILKTTDSAGGDNSPFIKWENTTTSLYTRMNTSGTLQIFNNAYASNILTLTQSGDLDITGSLDVSSNISTTNGFAQFVRNADATTPIILLKLENEFTGQNVAYDFKLGSSKELIIDGTSASSKIISSQPVEITGTLDVSGVTNLGDSIFIEDNLHIRGTASGGAIGFNRNTDTGALLNSTYGAFQLQSDTSGRIVIQTYAPTTGSSTGDAFRATSTLIELPKNTDITGTLDVSSTITASSYRIGGGTVLSGMGTVQLGSSGATSNINLTTSSGNAVEISGLNSTFSGFAVFEAKARIEETATDSSDFVNSPYHLELRSPDTLDSTDYISIRFHHINQTSGAIRYNSQGFFFQQGNSSTYRDIYVRDVISDRNVIATGYVQADEVLTTTLRTSSGQELVLNAGESVSYATGQTGEYVYVNAESGLEINYSPDNWASLWAGRKTHLLGKDAVTLREDTTIYGSASDTSSNAFTVRNLANTALFSVRNDGRIDFSGLMYGDGSALTNINADTLDSIDSSQFLRSDITDAFTGSTLIINNTLKLNANAMFVVSGSDNAMQRVDARTEDTDKARLYWYGLNSANDTNDRFRQAWYNGSKYYYVDAQEDGIKFGNATTTNGDFFELGLFNSTNLETLPQQWIRAYRATTFGQGSVAIGVGNADRLTIDYLGNTIVTGSIASGGGTFTSGIDSATNAGVVINAGDYIYAQISGNYLRKLIGLNGSSLEVGHPGTSLISEMVLRPGTSNIIKGEGRFQSDYDLDVSSYGAFHVERTLDSSRTTSNRGFADATIWDGNTSSLGYAGVDIRTNMNNGTYDHITSFQARPSFDTTTITDVEGVVAYADYVHDSTITNFTAFSADKPFTFDNSTITNFYGLKAAAGTGINGASITNFYGMYIGDGTVDATNKYAIFSDDNTIESKHDGKFVLGDGLLSIYTDTSIPRIEANTSLPLFIENANSSGGSIVLRAADSSGATRTVISAGFSGTNTFPTLYHNTNAKLVTTNTGVEVTGDYEYSTGEVAQKKGEFDYSTDASTSYTIASTDKGEVIGFTSASAVTVTVNAGSLTDVGDICYIDQMGSGEITITAGAGNSLLKNSSVQLKTNGLYSRVAIHKVSSTGYRVFGELKPV